MPGIMFILASPVNGERVVLSSPKDIDQTQSCSWIHDCLNIKDSSQAIKSTFSDCSEATGDICFEFLAYKPRVQMSSRVEFVHPMVWRDNWPQGLSEDAFLRLLPAFASTVYFQNRSIVKLQVLENVMLFRVHCPSDSGVNTPLRIGSGTVTLRVSSPSPHSKNTSSSATFEQESLLPLQQAAFLDIAPLVSHLRSSSTSVWKGPRAYMIAADEGTGKSTLLRHIFHQLSPITRILFARIPSVCDVQFVDISPSIPDLISQFMTCCSCDTTQPIALCGPTVLVIDDVPSQAMIYDSTSSVCSDGINAVSFLLRSLVMYANSIENHFFYVIAATSVTSSTIPRAFLGPPGFDHIIYLTSPDMKDREILIARWLSRTLRPHTSLGKLPNNASDMESWAQHIAALTAGYALSDIVLILKRSVAYQLSQCSDELLWMHVSNTIAALPPKQLTDLEHMGSSALTARRLRWDDIAGYTQQVKTLRKLLSSYITPPAGVEAASLQAAVPRPRGIVLHGPSGCGKSYWAKVIAHEINMNFVEVRSPSLLSKYFGETEASVRQLFRKARAAAPSVLFFDEFDVIAYNRGSGDGGDSGVSARVLSTFLNELDGISTVSKKGQEVLVIAACTELQSLDSALLRPGRLHHHIHLNTPEREDLIAVLEYRLNSIPHESIESSEVIGKMMQVSASSVSNADIMTLCRAAVVVALKECIASFDAKNSEVEHTDAIRLCSRHFDTVLRNM